MVVVLLVMTPSSARPGVSPSQIYYYFGDKKSLFKAVIAYDTDTILSIQEPMLTRLDSFDAL
jgi:TetR/AcrR family transcriptional regulator, transcriptional repressor for nem operon